MMNIEDLVRPNIRRLKPYRSARHDFMSGILLDANENAFGSAVDVDGLSLNRYPDPYQRELRAALAKLNDVSSEHVFAGVGSDEVIDLLIRIFCEPRADSIVVLEPTYGVYRVAADVNNVRVASCLLSDDFQIDIDATRRNLEDSTKIIFCCSPNNPTGNLLRRDDILALCQFTKAIVVVDEAYADFAKSPSLAADVAANPNLVILRTLSKAWGLAAIRIGYAVANPLIISYLLKVKAPYSINILSSTEALRALENKEYVRRVVTSTIAERERLRLVLGTLPLVQRVFPSDANFLLVRFKNARAVYEALAQRGIIVRDRSTEPKLNECLRISVGTQEQNDALLKVLKELVL
jgi:histidinol-phosphate aminotransferase